MLWDMLRYHNYDIRSPYNAMPRFVGRQPDDDPVPTDTRSLRDLRAAQGRWLRPRRRGRRHRPGRANGTAKSGSAGAGAGLTTPVAGSGSSSSVMAASSAARKGRVPEPERNRPIVPGGDGGRYQGRVPKPEPGREALP